MIKKTKKKKVKKNDGFRNINEIHETRGTEVEISGTDDMGLSDAEYNAVKYKGIERHLNIDVFYDLCALKVDGIGIKGGKQDQRKSFRASKFHMVLLSLLEESGVIQGTKGDILAGAVGLGLLANCEHFGVSPKIVKNTLGKLPELTDRAMRQDLMLINAAERLDFKNDACYKEIRKAISTYGNNQHGIRLVGIMNQVTGKHDPAPKPRNKKRVFSKAVLERFEGMTEEFLCDKMYILAKTETSESNPTLKVKLPKRLWTLFFDFKKIYLPGGGSSELLRACLVSGLYCIAKWVLDGRINKHEADFYVLIDKLDRYAAEHC